LPRTQCVEDTFPVGLVIVHQVRTQRRLERLRRRFLYARAQLRRDAMRGAVADDELEIWPCADPSRIQKAGLPPEDTQACGRASTIERSALGSLTG
jgi:hypothetical protein